MGYWHKDLDDTAVEEKAYELCKAEGRDPDQMTYISDDGIQQPYGPAFYWHIGDAVEALQNATKE